jgi:Catalase
MESKDPSKTTFSFASLAATLSHQVRVCYPPDKAPARRDAHPKHHGCVRATFTVRTDLPEPVQRGVFIPGKSYPALIRFSNAFEVRHDLMIDARGMAIKLLRVEGRRVSLPDLEGKVPEMLEEGVDTQDFLLVTHSEFFSRTAAEFVRIVSAIIKHGASSKIALAFVSLKPFRIAFRNIWAFAMTMRLTSNPLFVTYFSQTPYSMGNANGAAVQPAAKFCARPKQRPKGVLQRLRFYLRVLRSRICPPKSTENLLRYSLSRYLAERDATFEFCVQLRTDADAKALDDATRRWSTRAWPYVPVATIQIHKDPRYGCKHKDPRDECKECKESEAFINERLRLGERLSYTPWHALEAHCPLGSINLARLFVYAHVSQTRSGMNKTDARIPPEEIGIEESRSNSAV